MIASTLATVGATLIALFMPMYLDFRLRIRLAREKQEEIAAAAAEIVHAVEEAIKTYDEAVELIKTPYDELEKGPVRKLQERASRSQRVIDLLMRRRDLTDGIIRCAVDGAALAEGTASALEQSDGKYSGAMGAQQALGFNRFRAERAREQIASLRAYYNPGATA